jgi:hypothetical protein
MHGFTAFPSENWVLGRIWIDPKWCILANVGVHNDAAITLTKVPLEMSCVMMLTVTWETRSYEKGNIDLETSYYAICYFWGSYSRLKQSAWIQKISRHQVQDMIEYDIRSDSIARNPGQWSAIITIDRHQEAICQKGITESFWLTGIVIECKQKCTVCQLLPEPGERSFVLAVLSNQGRIEQSRGISNPLNSGICLALS